MKLFSPNSENSLCFCGQDDACRKQHWSLSICNRAQLWLGLGLGLLSLFGKTQKKDDSRKGRKGRVAQEEEAAEHLEQSFSQSWSRTWPFLQAQKHKHSQARHPPAATSAHTEDSPAVGQPGRHPAAPTTQPRGTAATLLPNTLCKHLHSDLHTT